MNRLRRTVASLLCVFMPSWAGAATLNITTPASNATLTTRTPTLSARADGFNPSTVSFYQETGPYEAFYDEELGTATPDASGNYALAYSFDGDGSYSVYASAADANGNLIRSSNTYFAIHLPVVLSMVTVGPPGISSSGTGVVSLSGYPSTDVLVALSVNDPAVSVPASVTVPANSQSASFPVTVQGAPGRRRVQITATCNGGSTSTAFLIGPWPHYDYTVLDIGALGGTSSVAAGINASGQLAGYFSTAGGQYHAFKTDSNGVATDVDPANPNTVYGKAINDSGQVAGYVLYSDGSRHVFRTDAMGHPVLLNDGNSAAKSYAQGINNSGVVTGYYRYPNATYRPFRAGADGALVPLAVRPDSDTSASYAINDAGQLAGIYYDDYGGSYGAITSPDGDFANATVVLRSNSTVYLYDINQAGKVTGGFYPTGYGYDGHILRADASGYHEDLGALPNYGSEGLGLNDAGTVVGDSYSYNPNDGTTPIYHALRYRDAEGLRDLNDLIDPASGWTLWAGKDVNNAGQICGTGLHAGQQHAFRLDPTVPNALYGDADGNGTVDEMDAVALLRVAGGLAAASNLLVSDVGPAPSNTAKGFGDGRVDAQDALRVLRYLHGLEPVWP